MNKWCILFHRYYYDLKVFFSFYSAFRYLNLYCTDWNIEKFDFTPAFPWSEAQYKVTAVNFPARGISYGHTPMQAAKRAVARIKKDRMSMQFDFSDPKLIKQFFGNEKV